MKLQVTRLVSGCVLFAMTTLCMSVAPAKAANSAAEPVQIKLWPKGAPGTPPTNPEDEPVLLMSKPSGGAITKTAVIILPGGGYGALAMDHEGTQVAEWFNKLGITAFVLKYRMRATGHQHPVPMMDGQRAIRTVRARASEWKLDPDKIAVMGFSAGGHLASTLATHFDAGKKDDPDPVERASSRPDFLVLCYPVISLTEKFMHGGSRTNLLGDEPAPDLVKNLSNETQVTPQTPPTFIFQTNEDKGVVAENAVAFYSALRRAGVPAELHIYERGPHGVGLARNIPSTRSWPNRLRDWLEAHGLLQLR
jgi:acetyl esterase/lipase